MSHGAAEHEQPSPAGTGRNWSGRTRGGVFGNWVFITLIRLAGVRPAYLLLVPVAFYFLFFAPKARRASEAFHHKLLGPSNLFSRAWRSLRHFYAFGQILIDRVAICSGQQDRFQFTIEGADQMQAAVAEGNGLIILTAHCGNWEAAAGMLCKRFDVPLNIVILDNEVARVRQLLGRSRLPRSFQVIEVDGSPNSSLQVVAALRRGEIVAMNGDRCVHDPGEAVNFLGDLAVLPVGPHVVAAISRAPVVRVFTMREGTYRYSIQIDVDAASHAQDRKRDRASIRQSVERFASRLEQIVRRYPLQWQNFYDYWDQAKMVNLSADDAAQENGGTPEAAVAPISAADVRMDPEFGAVQDLIPHRPPMVLVDRLVAFEEDSAVGERIYPADHAGTVDGVVLESALLESMAQVVGVYQGERARRLKLPPVGGILVGARGITFHRPARCERVLRIEIKITRLLSPFCIATGKVTDDGDLLVDGEMKFYLE